MALILTREDFHVGQGGFTAFKVKDNASGKKIFSIIFDCGSSTSRKKFCETSIFNRFRIFNEDDEIDFLVFSHLDIDHINMGGKLFAQYKVRNIVTPYLSNEVVLCFLSSISGSKYKSGLYEFCKSFYTEKGNSNIINGTRAFYNVSSSSRTPEDEMQAYKEIGDYRIICRFHGNSITGEASTQSLDEIIISAPGKAQNAELVFTLFQPLYTDNDSQLFKLKAAKYIFSSCTSLKDYEKKMGHLKNCYKQIHTDLNKTSLGLFLAYRPYQAPRQEHHILTGDMTINNHAIEFLHERLKRLRQVVPGLKCCPTRWTNLNFQLPHHGSKYSLDLSSVYLFRSPGITSLAVMHGKNRLKHPSPELLKEIFNLKLPLKSITE